MPLRPTEWPAAVSHQHGRGASTYVAFDLGRLYASTGLQHLATYMSWLLDGLLPARQIQVRAPFSVEVTVWTQDSPKRHIIHVANRTHSPTDMSKVTELVPVHDVEITTQSPFARPKVECRGGSVQTRSAGGKLFIKLLKLEAYAAIVIAEG